MFQTYLKTISNSIEFYETEFEYSKYGYEKIKLRSITIFVTLFVVSVLSKYKDRVSFMYVIPTDSLIKSIYNHYCF